MKTIEIAGVEFNFERIQPIRGTRKTWQVTVKKTGVVQQCFTGKTLAHKIQSIKDIARICGEERFKAESEEREIPAMSDECPECKCKSGSHYVSCSRGRPESQSSFAAPSVSSAEWEGYERIRPEEAVIGDEFFGRMLTWEVIKTRFQVTGVQVQKASCRRKQQNTI